MSASPLLDRIACPADLRCLSASDLPRLAQEVRERLVGTVARSGGHLGPNLGVVELTIALHRAFESPRDVLVFDTGHQAYVHKMLTGRASLDGLRRQGGVSGYPSRRESEHDVVENSHASTALSWADGIATGFAVTGQEGRRVVAVIGDGALTGGMVWEALNNLVVHRREVIVVVNDNGRSYAPTLGGMVPLLPALGAQYVGPVDGHDVHELERVFTDVARASGPVVVHVRTDKGRGFTPALADEAERFHGIPPIDPITGSPVSTPPRTWTQAFSDALLVLADERPDLVAVTAAMPGPTGLDVFARRHPDRFVDVGIAEQHAATMAAGLAFAGAHPVVAVYATFLNRALDQVLMDCALHRAPATFVLDRAGVTGDDGASHNGMWDMAFLRVVPGVRVAAPRDAQQLRELLGEAVTVDDGPTVVRFPKGAAGADIPAMQRWDGIDVLCRGASPDVLIVAVGPMATLALAAATLLAEQGLDVTVVDPRWVLPIASALVEMAAAYRVVAVLEDGIRAGGVADALTRAVLDSGAQVPVESFGVPPRFLEHATRAQVLDEIGLTAPAVAERIGQRLSALMSAVLTPAALMPEALMPEASPRLQA